MIEGNFTVPAPNRRTIGYACLLSSGLHARVRERKGMRAVWKVCVSCLRLPHFRFSNLGVLFQEQGPGAAGCGGAHGLANGTLRPHPLSGTMLRRLVKRQRRNEKAGEGGLGASATPNRKIASAAKAKHARTPYLDTLRFECLS